MQKLALVLLLEEGQEVEVAMVRSRVSFQGLRGFVRELRKGRSISQPKLAEAIGMPVRTYKAWELGNTETIKTHYILRAVRFLRGSLDLLAEIDDETTAEEGAAMAQDFLRRHPDPLQAVLDEAKATGATPRDPEAFNRFLELVYDGMDPKEAARIALGRP